TKQRGWRAARHGPTCSCPFVTLRIPSWIAALLRQAVDLHLGVAVQWVAIGRPPAVKADVAGLGALGIDELPLERLPVLQVFANAQAGAVVQVVVEEGGHALD